MSKRITKKVICLLVALTLLFSLTACGSTPAGNTNDPSSTQSSAKTPQNSESSPAATEGTNVSSGFEGPTEPAKAPEKLKIAFVSASASLSGCIVPIEAMEEICQRYGWEYQIFDGKGTPDVQNKSIMNAVSWGADAIVCVSILASAVQSGIQAANEANIPIVSASNGTDDPNPRLDLEYDFLYDIGPDYRGLGYAMAEWIRDNTTGSGKVVVYSCPGSYSVDYFEEGLLKGLKEMNITYSDGNKFTFEQLGDELNRMIIGYLTNNPDTEFVFLPFDPAAVSVVDGLESAGFTDVKVLGVLGNTEMCSLISQDSIAAATAAYDNVYMGYACMDQLIRLINGQDLVKPRNENLPYAIVDETNVPEEGQAWVPDYDYKESYFKLWD